MRNISGHNFGDSELRNINFSQNKVILVFLCRHDFLFARVTLSEVKILYLSTNHMQNVVEGIYFLDDTVLANNASIAETLARLSFDASEIGSERCGVYVSGIAGPELVAICDHVSVEVELPP